MKESKLQKLKKGEEVNFWKNLFIKSIDGVTILFFITTCLTFSGASQNVLFMTSIPAIILIALIMGISAFIAAKEEKIHFFTLLNRDKQDAEDLKEKRLLENLGIGIGIQTLAQEEITKDRKNWLNLMMQLNNGQNMTSQINPLKNGVTTWLSYIIGGTIPLVAYFFTKNTNIAWQFASIISLTSLFVLGIFKSICLKSQVITGAMITLFSGAFAGIAGYFIAKLFIQVI